MPDERRELAGGFWSPIFPLHLLHVTSWSLGLLHVKSYGRKGRIGEGSSQP